MSRRLATPSPAPNVTPEMLVGAPELALLAIVDETIRVACLALLAAQPALIGEPPCWRITSDWIAAARLLRDANRLQRSIARYRHCALQVLRDEPARDDEPPF